MDYIFNEEISEEFISRIEKLTQESKPKWGKMSVAQMLAHCCVTYEMVYSDKHKRPNIFIRFVLKRFVKKKVVSEKPFVRNGRTASQFLIDDDKVFETEKKRLVYFIKKTQRLGEKYFEGKESVSFGKLTSVEWNNLFYKHLDHHLNQFGK